MARTKLGKRPSCCNTFPTDDSVHRCLKNGEHQLGDIQIMARCVKPSSKLNIIQKTSFMAETFEFGPGEGVFLRDLRPWLAVVQGVVSSSVGLPRDDVAIASETG